METSDSNSSVQSPSAHGSVALSGTLAPPQTAGPTLFVRERGGFVGSLLLLLRLALGALFILAAYVKLTAPLDFSDSVKAFKILPDHLAQLATFAIPWTELICGVALIVGWWTRAAAALIGLTLLVFIAGIASVLARGISVKCGCFGKLQPFCTGPLGMCNILQNTVMLAAAFLIVVGGAGLLSIDRRNGHRPGG